jgi:chemotaxis protein methyltransferase CheR
VADAVRVDCVAFLQWALPRLGRRWAGYRKVRRQVCRRVHRRAAELGIESLAAYRDHLERHPEEWRELDGLTNITISRFYRDRVVFEFLRTSVLQPGTRVWSAGCASGEEPYTIALLAHDAEILATDVDPAVLGRAQAARYAPSSLRELPAALRDGAFGEDGVLAPRIRRRVTLMHHDIRDEPPAGPFDLVLCRNLAFTYFDDAAQRATLRRIASVTAPGGALVVGAHEELPAGQTDFEPWAPQHGVFRVH